MDQPVKAADARLLARPILREYDASTVDGIAMQPANQFENLADSECGKRACGPSVWKYLYADPTVDHAGHVSDMRMTNAIVETGIHSLGWFPLIALQIFTHLESYRTFLKPSFRTHVFWAS